MARILVLGGGRQGRIIANDLSDTHAVTVADIAPVSLPGVQAMQRDLSRPTELVGTMREHDVIVGALPARLGFAAAQASIEAKRHYVDLSYYVEDASSLHDAARAAGVAVMPDCGLAPGLSNLIAGRALATRRPKEINIQVGGFAADKTKPYGYVVTWSPEDLLDEYLRPARIIRNGRVDEEPALSGIELIKIPGVGELEAFFTDGLRTLLSEAHPPVGEPRIRDMTGGRRRFVAHVKDIFERRASHLGNAPFNAILHSSRPYYNDPKSPFHWHFEVVPRLGELAGLASGSGAHINPMAPEAAAMQLRSAH